MLNIYLLFLIVISNVRYIATLRCHSCTYNISNYDVIHELEFGISVNPSNCEDNDYCEGKDYKSSYVEG